MRRWEIGRELIITKHPSTRSSCMPNCERTGHGNFLSNAQVSTAKEEI